MKKKKTLYLAGPIHGVEDPVSWRMVASNRLSHKWNIIDPINDPTFAIIRELIELDLRNVRQADIVLAKVDAPSWGTAMEIFAARAARVQVWAFDAPEQRSPWLQYHVSRFYPTLDAAIKALA